MNWTLLQKYLSGESNPEELRQVESWLKESQKNRLFMSSLRDIWNIEPSHEMEVNARAAWELFQHKLSAEQGPAKADSPPQPGLLKKTPQEIREVGYRTPAVRRQKRVAYSLAAAAVLAIIAMIYLFAPVSPHEPEIVSLETPRQKITSKRGQRVTFRLFDGTQVQLNADSKLEVAHNFGDSTRTVYLEGEAYFDVAKDASRPFRILVGDTYTRVMGTKFGIKAYPEDDEVQVVVEEGKVALGPTARPALEEHLVRNQMGVITDEGVPSVTTLEDTGSYLGWKEGRLVFNGTLFREVRPRLERWYDITIVLHDSAAINKQKLTASFRDEPLAEVMNAITFSLGLKYEIDGQTIRFLPVE